MTDTLDDVRLRDVIADANRPLVGRAATELLMHRMSHTLSSDVLGLTSPEVLNEILLGAAVLRPIVSAAKQVDLTAGKLLFPEITQRPAAIRQPAEKTQGGDTNLQVDEGDVDANTYSAGGNMSWQVARFATPDSLSLWMELATAAYARATEVDAADALVAAVTVTAPGGTDLASWVAAISSAAATIQTSSDYVADTIFADPGSAAELLGFAYGATPSGPARVAGMDVVSSAGLVAHAPVVIVGAAQALVCAETPNAPVQLRAVEPAIGGIEVGVIGSFACVVPQPEAFVKLT